MSRYDALILVSFGGPEGPDEVIPFLENTLRGRNVPHERLLAVAQHYQHFGGVSPINEQNRDLIATLSCELESHGIKLPIYFGNRNWHPLLPDTLRQMADDGVRRALAFFTSIFSSYSGCRQYRENILAAQQTVGPQSPQVDKIRAFFNHPGFVEAMADRVRDGLSRVPDDLVATTQILFTAHSIPTAMANNCQYETQLKESCRLVAEALGHEQWRLVFQSRSGPPNQPWLEPDIGEALRDVAACAESKHVVVAPIGFISDHIEVLYDLDEEAKRLAEDLQLTMHRTSTVGLHPRFVSMIRQLIEERLSDNPARPTMGNLPPSPDVCPVDCCFYKQVHNGVP